MAAAQLHLGRQMTAEACGSSKIIVAPTIPDPDKPVRTTNQLNYIRNSVMPTLFKAQNSQFFKQPVNTAHLKIPNYYEFVREPMDLGTIRQRLNNKYYWSGAECLHDFNRMFTSCYIYNDPSEAICKVAVELEKILVSKLVLMPAEEKVEQQSTRKPDTFLQSVDGASGSDALRRGLRARAPPKKLEYSQESTHNGSVGSSTIYQTSDSESISSVESSVSDVDSKLTSKFEFCLKQQMKYTSKLLTLLQQCEIRRKPAERKRRRTYSGESDSPAAHPTPKKVRNVNSSATSQPTVKEKKIHRPTLVKKPTPIMAVTESKNCGPRTNHVSSVASREDAARSRNKNGLLSKGKVEQRQMSDKDIATLEENVRELLSTEPQFSHDMISILGNYGPLPSSGDELRNVPAEGLWKLQELVSVKLKIQKNNSKVGASSSTSAVKGAVIRHSNSVPCSSEGGLQTENILPTDEGQEDSLESDSDDELFKY